MTSAVETDQEPGLAHPRATFAYQGNQTAEAELAKAFAAGRMQHAWLLTGPKGIGKATLAYRFARHALGARAIGPRPFDVDPDDAVCRRIAARSHGDLHVLRRGQNDRGKPRTEITVDEARAFVGFFNLKSAEGGWRVAIIDTVDDLNRSAANAILKTLEEPPPKTVVLLLCNAPGSILPTIRSRCRRLDLRPLDDAEVRSAIDTTGSGLSDEAAVRFAGGRPGRALALAAAEVGAIQEGLMSALQSTHRDGPRAFLDPVFARSGDRAQRLVLFISLARHCLHRAVKVSLGLTEPDPRDRGVFSRFAAPGRAQFLAEAYGAMLEIERETDGLDMDPTHAFARAARVLERVAE
jgi:DNA polymerase-3 subunit delta'